jgi:hypothetical protein
MPRYFFRLKDGQPFFRTATVADDEAARAVALDLVRDLARKNQTFTDAKVVSLTPDGRVVCEVQSS